MWNRRSSALAVVESVERWSVKMRISEKILFICLTIDVFFCLCKALHEEETADDKPYVKHAGKVERFRSRLLELVDACVAAEGCHGECEHEGGDNLHYFQAVGEPLPVAEHGVKTAVDTYHKQEDEGEPRDVYLVFLLFAAVCAAFPAVLFPQKPRHGDEDRYKEHDAHHFHDEGVCRYLVAHGIAGTNNVCHFVERRTCVDAHLLRGEEVGEAAAVHDRIEEHGQCAEDDHRADCHRCLVGLAFDDGFRTEDCCRATDGGAGGRHEGCLAVNAEPPSEPYAEENGHDDHDAVCKDGLRSDGDDILECQAEAVEDDAQAQHTFGAELYSAVPLLRLPVP